MVDLPPDPRGHTGTPRWVKVFGIIVVVLILLLGGLGLLGVGGEHGPGRHAPSGGAGAQATPEAGYRLS